jgi:hypothetical protein
MSPLVKTKRQANFKDFKRFGAFKGLVEQKSVVFNPFVCKLGFLARVPKNPNLHKNSSNKLLFLTWSSKYNKTFDVMILSYILFRQRPLYRTLSELLPQKKRQYLGKCDNLNFKEKKSYLKG